MSQFEKFCTIFFKILTLWSKVTFPKDKLGNVELFTVTLMENKHCHNENIYIVVIVHNMLLNARRKGDCKFSTGIFRATKLKI